MSYIGSGWSLLDSSKNIAQNKDFVFGFNFAGAKEQLFSKVKHHFRKWLGKENISAIFQRHGGIYTFITDLDLSREKLYEILWANSVAMVQGKLSSVDALFAVTKRQWRIRTVFTGNWAELRANLKIKESDTNDNKSV